MGWSQADEGGYRTSLRLGRAICVTSIIVLLLRTNAVTSQIPVEGPRTVRIINATNDSLTISWSFSSPSNLFNLSTFTITAVPITSYTSNPVTVESSVGSQQRSFVLLGLSPATSYNISVWAIDIEGNVTEKSYLSAWTRLGDLPVPPNPAVEEMFQDGKKVLVVTINPPTEFHGPITKYRVVVMEQDSLMRFDPDKLVNFAEADRDGLPYYIAGDLKPLQKPLLFIVGSNSSSNPPLAEEQKYDIIVGVISELNGETKSVFSVPSREPASAGLGRANVGASRYLNAEDETDLALRRRDAVLVFILSVAIGVLGFLLVAAFILYFILRQQYASKRRSDELILKIHDHDSESGYFGVNGKLHLEEGADLNGFYSRLCDLYWQIPRPQLHISDIVLGQGMFGLVRVGKILRNGEEISAQIQRCGAHFALSDRERRVLLAELETVVQVGKHPNVVEFIGGCEEGDALWMAVEHPNNPLRGVLLASRQQTENRISSIPEYRLMEIAISLADGMKHLAHRGVCHGCLSTRSVMVHLPEMTPKISNFSISRYTPLGKKLDYTRWTAPEAMRRRVTQKTDVWSFGVLLWELFTFAGTPYVDLKSNEVQARITKGHRLPQPRGVNTSLFQQMLNCWEMDPDERPSFEFLARELRTVASEDPLRFPQQIKYIYDKFDPLADES